MQENSRKPVRMERVARARLTPGIGKMMDELVEVYGLDESELLRRLIVDAHKRRPALTGEVIRPVKIAAQPGVMA